MRVGVRVNVNVRVKKGLNDRFRNNLATFCMIGVEINE